MDLEVVAKGLNGEEREALLSAAECKGGKWYTTHVAAFYRDTSLQRSGILTPLGLAVRGHLLKHPTGER